MDRHASFRMVASALVLAACTAEGNPDARPERAAASGALAARAASAPAQDSVIRFLVLGDDSLLLAARDSITTVTARWGGQPIEHSDSASVGNEERSVCYRLHEESHHMFLVLRADPHMDYPTINGFTLADASPPGWDSHDCADHAVDLNRVRTSQGLYIGMPMDSLELAMGSSGQRKGHLIRYEFHGVGTTDSASATADVPAGTEYDIVSTVEIVERAGRVASIKTWYAEAL